MTRLLFLWIFGGLVFSSQMLLAQEGGSEEVEPLQAERDRLINTLKNEVEPNLIPKDVKKLNRNVMRLGSYRREWSESGEEFLVANAALAELYLYNYSLVGNSRLNRRIIETLSQFKQFRYPRGPLAFAEKLAQTPEDKAALLRVFANVLAQSKGSWGEYLDFVFGPWGEDIAGEDKVYLALQGCADWARAMPNRQVQFQEILTSLRGFWANFVGYELKACFRDLS